MKKILFLVFFLLIQTAFSQANEAENHRAPETKAEAREQLKEVSIYPNPVVSYFEVVYPSSVGDIKVEVYDILGKKLVSRVITPEDRSVQVSKLSKGIYMVRLSSEKASKIFKIVKQ